MKYKLAIRLLAVTFFISGCAHVASANQFKFSDLDQYPVSGTPDQQYQQLIQHGRQYTEEHLPLGSSMELAINQLTTAGAHCEFDDTSAQKLYACEYERPAGGVAGLFEKIIWMIVLYPDEETQTIKSITVDTWSDGL